MLYLLPVAMQTDGPARFMPPYWCVHHGMPQAANMERDEVDVDVILSLLSNDEKKSQARPAKNTAPKFTVPVMTNTKALLNGTELVFPKATEKEKPNANESKTTTWLAKAQKDLKSEQKKD